MTSDAETPTCSARGCRREAAWMLLWRNPRLHGPERVKRWAACEEHLATLREFLTSRGFPCETEAVPPSGAMG
ncbi:hypothetical protein LO763_25690 [Glycomyces sp. A-F 0318]|uniref:hypothetical protein n=1 Tax=Glycomyces amatae TaxID=2881355 RepID=UPI001E554A4F|nr:hypothetical protein [Glycomyces amatae]MCD0447014.1 hypothetical protein [Glycomyces amatae]